MYYGRQPGQFGDPKPEPKIKGKSKLKTQKKPTGERTIFKAISDSRKHVSFISGEFLGEDMPVSCFAHVLSKAKNKYPLFKMNPKNIVLLHPEEHYLWDFGSRQDLRKLPEWNRMFELEEKLKEEYKNELKG